MLDVLIESPEWQALGIEPLAQRAVAQVLKHFDLPDDDVEISLLACTDARIAALNSDFRDKPTATNVLSWPAMQRAVTGDGEVPTPPETGFNGEFELGDIAIAYETCAREAQQMQKPLEDHATHLIVHGLLHLLGYDHVRDRDATLMQALETEILGKLGLDDPY